MPDIWPISDSQLFMKVGMENGTDYWTTGTFDESTNQFLTASTVGALPTADQRCDYGAFYSSKSFAVADATTSSPQPRMLIGWVGEEGGPLREWAGIQSVPRLVTADPEHVGRAVFNPIAQIEQLRIASSKVEKKVGTFELLVLGAQAHVRQCAPLFVHVLLPACLLVCCPTQDYTQVAGIAEASLIKGTQLDLTIVYKGPFSAAQVRSKCHGSDCPLLTR
jgi:hypothetical protein